jgi:hypothetical protein
MLWELENQSEITLQRVLNDPYWDGNKEDFAFLR